MPRSLILQSTSQASAGQHRKTGKYVRTLVEIIATRGRGLRQYLRHRRALLELQNKDTRMLEDMGITQADIDQALRKFRFWI